MTEIHRIKKYNNRVALAGLYNVGCSDWHLSWGLGTTKIGKLYYDPTDKIFIWRGWSQGRHGQTWNLNSEYHFKIDREKIDGKLTDIITMTWRNTGAFPRQSEVKKSIEMLKTLFVQSK